MPARPLIIGLHREEASSTCFLEASPSRLDFDLIIRERLTRVKRDRDWLYRTLAGERERWSTRALRVAETSYGESAAENALGANKRFPLRECLRVQGLEAFSPLTSAGVRFLTHHRCHAAAAAAVSPFDRALVFVMDGLGSRADAFEPRHPEAAWSRGRRGRAERLSAYVWRNRRLDCVQKQWQGLDRGRRDLFSIPGVSWGTVFEILSAYIFGDKSQAGKVMGLAPFGQALPAARFRDLRRWMPKEKAFKGRGKSDWERSEHFHLYADLAATLQALYERDFLTFAAALRQQTGETRLILAGGCALNCVANQALLKSGLFDEIYVPPFPGDEGVSLGAAVLLALEGSARRAVEPRGWDEQTSFFGPRRPAATLAQARELFPGERVSRPADLALKAGRALAKGRLVAVFRGRSESGPRALGHRSLLANPARPGIRERLNGEVKGRESFRPYGGTVLDGYQHVYFEVERSFRSPFMNFAPAARDEWAERLAGIVHVDGTSRVQTLHRRQDRFFHDVIRRFGERSGFFCVLNTSLNVMGEPIAETPQDAARFFARAPVDHLVLDDLWITR
ncbi:MAG: carbamoyltransferase C-terminal domain-containing protein [Elusimicrobiota bacterium]